MNKIFIAIFFLWPFSALAQVGVSRADTTLQVVFGDSLVKWRSQFWTLRKIDSATSFYLKKADTLYLSNSIAAKVNKAGDLMSGPLEISQNIAARKFVVAMKDPGTQQDAPTALGATSEYITIGGGEWNAGSYRNIGFGYRSAGANHSPGFIGYQETSTSSNTSGDIIMGARPNNNNIAPSIYLRVRSDGQLLAELPNYRPSLDSSLTTRKFVYDSTLKRADTATLAEATAGTVNNRWMTPLTTKAAIQAFVPPSGGAVWGTITGVLSNQIDLKDSLNVRERAISMGTATDYWRGDKTWQTLDKNAVGLNNVDNTSDANKPISSAVQAALNTKLTTPPLTNGVVLGTSLSANTLGVVGYSQTPLDDKLVMYGAGGVIKTATPTDSNDAVIRYYVDTALYARVDTLSLKNLTTIVGAKVNKAGDTMSGLLEIAQNTATRKLILAMKDPGTQNDAPTALGAPSEYIAVGGGEWNGNSYRNIGFGYRVAAANHSPGFIGYQETSTSSNTRGDIIMGGRSTNDNIAPSVYFRVRSDGQLIAALAGYLPTTDSSLITRKFFYSDTATTAEALAGTVQNKWMTPFTTKVAIQAFVPPAGGASWGTITGTLSSQTDLQTALNAKENTLSPGTAAQYFRGDKTWQTLDKTAVGLSNVDNTSDANKPVSTATQTALALKTNQTDFTSHVANVNVGGHVPTGGTQGQVLTRGTGNSMDWATPSGGGGGSPAGNNGDIQYNNNGSFGGLSIIPAANLGTGIASAGSALFGDATWKQVFAKPSNNLVIPATNNVGDITELSYSSAADAFSVAVRIEDGHIPLPQTPTQPTHAASKSYVDRQPPQIFDGTDLTVTVNDDSQSTIIVFADQTSKTITLSMGCSQAKRFTIVRMDNNAGNTVTVQTEGGQSTINGTGSSVTLTSQYELKEFFRVTGTQWVMK